MSSRKTRKISKYQSGKTLKAGILLVGNYVEEIFMVGESVEVYIDTQNKEPLIINQ